MLADHAMSTSRETVDFLLDQLAGTGPFSVRQMFGEYCLYLYGKPIGFICDNQFFLKPTEAGLDLIDRLEEGFPYRGAQPYLLIPADRWENRKWLTHLLITTANALPAPKPRKKRARLSVQDE